jgi:hypothetical protein
MNEDIVIPGMFFLTIVVLALGIPLVRAYVRRMSMAPVHAPLPHDLTQRLDRIEAIVETVAVEVERLSEGQRFTTRLLSEGATLASLGAGRAANALKINGEAGHA